MYIVYNKLANLHGGYSSHPLVPVHSSCVYKCIYFLHFSKFCRIYIIHFISNLSQLATDIFDGTEIKKEIYI